MDWVAGGGGDIYPGCKTRAHPALGACPGCGSDPASGGMRLGSGVGHPEDLEIVWDCKHGSCAADSGNHGVRHTVCQGCPSFQDYLSSPGCTFCQGYASFLDFPSFQDSLFCQDSSFFLDSPFFQDFLFCQDYPSLQDFPSYQDSISYQDCSFSRGSLFCQDSCAQGWPCHQDSFSFLQD